MKLDVEFLGRARRLTQVKRCLVEVDDQATLRDVIRRIASRFPALVGPVVSPETFELTPSYMLNIDGRRAAKDLDMPAQDGQRIILMFMEAGG
ncbi:MAG: MoaD/ThiS family protein [Anaerolineales bacterium]